MFPKGFGRSDAIDGIAALAAGNLLAACPVPDNSESAGLNAGSGRSRMMPRKCVVSLLTRSMIGIVVRSLTNGVPLAR